MRIPRYVTGAFLFALIWAAIVYVNGKMTDPLQLLVMVVMFTVIGSALSWFLSVLLNWYKNRK